MAKLLKRYKNIICDFFYSFAAHALPTVMLQLAIYPIVARRLGPEENGLFLTLLNVVRMCVTVLIMPLSNMRIIEKRKCSENVNVEKNFNFAFLCTIIMAIAVSSIFHLVYRGADRNIWAYLRLLVVLILLGMHDFYAIAFRVVINYKLLLADNSLIVLGYAVGCVLFWLSGYWELIFICGYSLGLGVVLTKSGYWRKGIRAAGAQKMLPEYSQLCSSTCLNNATVYCDKMLIYPMLGGYAVSIYNAAAVASKVMSLISAPICNVLLSYIVDIDNERFSFKSIRKTTVAVIIGGAVIVYGCFYLASIVLCRTLYPQFYAESIKYMPIVLTAVFMETVSSVFRLILLRFKKTGKLLAVSSTKASVYLGSVFLSNALGMGLKGFCWSILLADGIRLILLTTYSAKIMKSNRKS